MPAPSGSAKLLDAGAADVLVCSTGLIGERLPMDRLLPGIEQAAAGSRRTAAPTPPRRSAPPTRWPRPPPSPSPAGWTVGGMAKGAGMLAPSLATMLCVLTTDAVADSAVLDAALRAAVRTTFDRLDADGCMSTNDTVVLLASGASGVAADPMSWPGRCTRCAPTWPGSCWPTPRAPPRRSRSWCTGAAGEDDAVQVGRAIARNNLLKCALFGNDPNWGRVLAAIGTTTAAFEPDQLDVAINGVRSAGPARRGTAATWWT